MCYPQSSTAVNLFMRSTAVVLARKGHHVTVLSSDKNEFIHPRVEKYDLHFINYAWSNLLYCGKFKNLSITCDEQQKIGNYFKSFWNKKIVKEIYNNRQIYDVLITPSFSSEFCFPFVYNSSTSLVLVKTHKHDFLQQLSYVSLSTSNFEDKDALIYFENYIAQMFFEHEMVIPGTYYQTMINWLQEMYSHYQDFIKAEVKNYLPEITDIYE